MASPSPGEKGDTSTISGPSSLLTSGPKAGFQPPQKCYEASYPICPATIPGSVPASDSFLLEIHRQYLAHCLLLPQQVYSSQPGTMLKSEVSF